jgi:hypothetical protein
MLGLSIDGALERILGWKDEIYDSLAIVIASLMSSGCRPMIET